MTRLLLVRHAHPSANWDRAPDAGLDALGAEQARALVGTLTDALGADAPVPIVTSPLRRTRETAAPLVAHWGREATIDPAVGEIPSPTDEPVDRGRWLGEVLTQRWGDAAPELHRWRGALLDALGALAQPTVVVTHYVAINTAVGAALGDDRLVSWSPAHASVTELALEDGTFRVVTLGDEAPTTVA